MRKNAIDKTLTPIDGGVCAPEGFSASAVYCGIAPFGTPFYQENREDLALIVSDKPVPTACVFANEGVYGAPVLVSKKHLRFGKMQAVVLNGGVANLGVEDGEKFAQKICGAFWRKLRIEDREVICASTGAVTGKFPVEKILEKTDDLIDGLGKTNEHSLGVARAVMTLDKSPKQLSYSFYIGDYLCKIGAVFKGGKRVCPNMATMLCVLTTDVNINTECLQKALNFAVSETLNLLDIDGVSSPNDTVCVMANGKAGNYQISCVDTEYKKFVYFLSETLKCVCLELAKEQEDENKIFSVEVKGAKSKAFARSVAKRAVGASAVRDAIKKGEIDAETLYFACLGANEPFKTNCVEICVQSSIGKCLLIEEGKRVVYSLERLKAVLQGENLSFFIHFHSGNYGATAIGIAKKE